MLVAKLLIRADKRSPAIRILLQVWIMGGEARTAHQKLYINVMELLVAEEVSRQLDNLPERVSKYIKRIEVETFALNRLPSLYASSEKGLQHQYERAQRELKPQVLSAVRQAFAAVQVDPIRLSQPLQLNQEEEAVLQALREFLKTPDLTWKSALKEIQRLQYRRRSSRKQSSIPPPPPPPPPERRRTYPTEPPQDDPDHDTTWRPGTYGSRLSWRPRHPHSGSEDGGFGENAR
ncbi:late competence development ComFB family protein [Oscillatoria sp. CS-180]|uniref:late competence development ComFB family protein n=1 Tax=Oscillatoria sp. CS-180 TaxID=3021720 RepID=UPI002330802B|nr:late competence development ComFB family protein [Oscillatoria sp. CS-180]MDB9526373.1 late competence development ComFB family protein [Oscillatoria sp. CS-180]